MKKVLFLIVLLMFPIMSYSQEPEELTGSATIFPFMLPGEIRVTRNASDGSPAVLTFVDGAKCSQAKIVTDEGVLPPTLVGCE